MVYIDLFTKKGRELLANLSLPAVSAGRLQACLRLVDQLSNEIAAAEQQLLELFQDDGQPVPYGRPPLLVGGTDPQRADQR